MSSWNLAELLSALHDDIQRRLSVVRKTMGHPVAKGDAAESVWLELLTTYLPRRYETAKAFVVDSKGVFSQQIDIVIFDRQYSPFIFKFQGETVVPAESVYAVFEAKQSINADEVRYAKEKVKSVRGLHRTSLPIPHAGGVYRRKRLPHIYGGLLTFESDWSPDFGKILIDHLKKGVAAEKLDLGCVASHGYFKTNAKNKYDFVAGGRPATAFLFTLISRLQVSATVPMIDVQAYAQWLTK